MNDRGDNLGPFADIEIKVCDVLPESTPFIGYDLGADGHGSCVIAHRTQDGAIVISDTQHISLLRPWCAHCQRAVEQLRERTSLNTLQTTYTAHCHGATAQVKPLGSQLGLLIWGEAFRAAKVPT